MCFTRVCSRASSASAQNSSTEPGQSESLQTFPVKQEAQIMKNRHKHHLIIYKVLCNQPSVMLGYDKLHYLFNDHMFAMIIQPYRHFRGETKLPAQREDIYTLINQIPNPTPF